MIYSFIVGDEESHQPVGISMLFKSTSSLSHQPVGISLLLNQHCHCQNTFLVFTISCFTEKLGNENILLSLYDEK